MGKETDITVVKPGDPSRVSKVKFSNHEYNKHFSKLVNLERKEEMRRHEQEIKKLSGKQREKRGRAVLHCSARNDGMGYGGTFLVKFVRKKGMPDTEIAVGDLVRISKRDPLSDRNPYGTVVEKTGYSLQVSFNDKPPKWMYHKNVRLDLYVNDVTFKRMLQAINDVSQDHVKNITLTSSLLSKKQIKNKTMEIHSFFNNKLNESQKQTVKNCLSSNLFHLIHGPPGTGKTITCVEVIEQVIEENQTVLACADSNTAVDNLVEKLVEQNRSVVRIGHPARVTPMLREHSLDYLLEENETFQKALRVRNKAYDLKEKQDQFTFPSGRWRRGLSNTQIKKLASKNKGSRGISEGKIKEMATSLEFQDKINNLFNEIDILEGQAVKELLEECDVVCTTNASAGSEVLNNHRFDICVIDEATQACEPSCLIPIVKADKIVMAGDHKQLPPTILNEEAEKKGLSISLFERLIALYGNGIKSLLTVQYRMNEKIMGFSNHHFYNDNLQADESVKNHTIQGLLTKNVFEENAELKWWEVVNPSEPIVWIDTKKQKGFERSRSGSTSKENIGEARLIQDVTSTLLQLGIKSKHIGLITPYYDQKGVLNSMIGTEKMEIDTVDGFQGREKEIILVSLTRSNPHGNIGFLKDLRRLNVSVTRARRKLIIIGDSSTVCTNETYKSFYDFVTKNGQVINS
ncbi:MAG: IGHMBP2 family helicase [Candidatus Thermoplasmatota archaeon]|nr:IGHMBP2 family helicase [Candidatus Thermoplasmatota archaeon]